jgi:calcineurin-like phosphoesterase family protein
MTNFYTSDLHVHHRKVASIRWQRVNPTAALPEDLEAIAAWHDDLLVRNWNAVVAKDDLVFVLGDLAVSGTKTSVDRALDLIATLHGRKRLYPGNHDPVHAMNRDATKWKKRYHEVFEDIDIAGRRKFTLCDGSVRNVMMSHFPYTGDRDQDDRDPQWRLRDCGDWLLHGHLHSEGSPFHTLGTRQIDVGLDPWNLAPVAEKTLIELIELLEGLRDPVFARTS